MTEQVFYYFLEDAVNLLPYNNNKPYITQDYLGEVGDYIEIDGAGYRIKDYTEEILDFVA